MKSSKNKVSVVICHHVGDLIHDLYKSLLENCSYDLDIIVVTSDKNLDLPCTMVYSTEGPAKKRNIGVGLAKSNYVAFFDDDVEIYDDCIENMYNSMVAGVGMVYGKLHNFEFKNRFDEAGSFITSTGFLWSRAEQNLVDVGQYDYPEEILAGKSASCMVNKEVFNKVGGFDEDFYILGEETDLSWRMWLNGYKVLWVPSSYAEHKFNTRFKPVNKHYNSTRVQFMGCRNYITMLIKNLGKEHLWIVPIHAGIWFIAGLAMIGTLKIRQGANILRAIFYIITHLPSLLRKRSKVQKERVINESDLWEKISKSTHGGYYVQRFCRYLRIGLHG